MRWILASLFILLGLGCHLTTVMVSIRTMRDCLASGQFSRQSGMVLVGPVLLGIATIIVGIHLLWWIPGLLLLLEIALIVSSAGVIRATQATRRPS